ncbi:hypothetical protein BH09GEM1_BH09GEM1_33360 [soil metagenome]
MTLRVVLAAVIFASLGGVAASRLIPGSSRVIPGERLVGPPVAVQASFRRFSDSAGVRLLDTLFRLGYHGGYSWDEKSGAIRANLLAEPDSGSAADSVQGIYEGIISLDLHHDSITDIPGTLSLRFVNLRNSPRWVLLTTDGLPEDPSDTLPIESLQRLPHNLHNAITASFTDRADAFAYWKALEHAPAPKH